jgi:hypothetical protein
MVEAVMRSFALLLLALALPLPAAGDTVRLTNGRAYEGVIAETLPEGVRIRLAFGYLVLPHDQVVAVERAPSALAEYLRRKTALSYRADVTAADWLALARWAKANELYQGVREAGQLAAELDPELPGLEPLLRPFGLVLFAELGRWMPLDEAMARRGLVRYEGEWISKEEQRQRLAERARLEAMRAEAEAARRMAAAAERMQRVEEETRRREAERWYYPPLVFYPVPGFVVGFPGGRPHHGREPHEAPEGGRRGGYDDLRHRQPGSLLPPGDPGAPPSPPSPPPANRSSVAAPARPASGG